MSSSFLSAEKRAKFSQKIDAEVQEQIIEKLSQSYKGHKFVAEEPSEIASQDMIKDRDVWIIDPIDGSHNFASYLPSFAISICYVYEDSHRLPGFTTLSMMSYLAQSQAMVLLSINEEYAFLTLNLLINRLVV